MKTITRQRENGKWQAIISYKVNNEWKQKSKGGFDRKKDAELWAKEMSFELQKLEKSGVLGNEYTLAEVFELFFEFKNFDKLSSILYYNSAMQFFEVFQNELISDIRIIELQRYVNKKRAETGLAFNIYINALKTIYNFAIKDLKACTENIASKLTKAKREDTREKFITEELYAQILKNIKPEKEKLFLRTAYETGARRSEILGITTQNVNDFKINICQQYDEYEKMLSTELKTKNSYREVPISKELFYDLKKADCNIDGRIFYNVSGQIVNQKLRKYNVSMHCFRHTRASILVSQNFDLALIAKVIGDNIQTIMNVYTHINENELEYNFEMLRNAL